jgi:acylphosphatase
MFELHAIISGRVQGVGFRDATARCAESLQLAGWVRNLRDGRVQVYARGSAEGVAQLRAWLVQGPDLARVDTCEAQPASCNERALAPSQHFITLPTA